MNHATTSQPFKRVISSILCLALILTTCGYPFVTRADDDSAASSTTVADTGATSDASTADAPTDTATDTSPDTDTPAVTAPGDATTASSTDTDATSTASDASSTDTTDASTTATTTPAAPAIDTGSAASSQIDSSTPSVGFTSVSTTTPGTSTTTGDDTDATTTEATTTDATTPTTTATSTPVATSTPSIESGVAVALANILNIVNTNFVNATGASVLLNYVDPVTGDIDLRNASSSLTSGAFCQSFVCSGSQGATVNLQSDGTIQNAVVLNATSGGNAIDDPEATQATIGTGDAYAGLNLINLANTNIVNSNYLLVTLNAFQGVNGDIVFPSLTDFLDSLTSLSTPSSISLGSDASVSNDITTTAGTGDNTVGSSTDSSIATGQANSSGNVFNQLNANMLGGSNVTLLFRVQGDWAGQVFGAPAGLTWTKDAAGNVYLFTDASGTPSSSMPGSLTASSTGGIANNVDVVALTGQNAIQDAGSAVITTGNADAAANVINIANTNIVGKNWILAIVNIFGNFTGNIDFGRPDLFAGIQASAPNSVVNGSSITYTLSVINNGDADANNATLTDSYDTQHLALSDASVPYTTNDDGSITWDLGTIPSGKAEQITYTAQVQGAGEGTPMQTTISAQEPESDNNDADNSDSVTVTTYMPPSSGGQFGFPTPQTAASSTSTGASPLDLQVTRTDTAVIPDTSTHLAHEKLIVYNPDSATSTPVVLHDILSDPQGAQLADQAWKLGVVRPHEKVVIDYDAQFASSTPLGTYHLSSFVVGSDGTIAKFANNGSILVLHPIAGSVLGASTSHPTQAGSAGTEGSSTVPSSTISGLFGTPRALAAGEAAAGSAPAEGLLFWVTIIMSLLILMGAASTITYYTRRRP